MRFSLSWIREFVEITGTPEELARTLTAAGLSVETVEAVGDDHLFEIEIFSNRPDCMNVYGVAREIAAATDRSLCPYPGDLHETEDAPVSSGMAKVTIEDGDLCGRYDARIITGVTVGESPAWMARRLEMIGLRPVNNVVDATNYVLWEYGHPMHAFDYATLADHELIIRRAHKGEVLVTLDDVRRTLDIDMLVIADTEHPVGLGGVMGGASTMVREKTTDILIESAWFDPVSVRRTAKKLSMSTDASYRFERGTDIEATVPALNRVAALIAEMAGGTVCRGVIEDRRKPPAQQRIRLRPERTSLLLGIDVGPEQIQQVLEGLGFELEQNTAGFEVTVPTHRQDIEREVDLIEEVGRGIGYDSIAGRLPHIAGSGGVRRLGHRREESLRRGLSAAGCYEAATSSFVFSEVDWGLRQRLTPDEPAIEAVRIANPIAADQETLRTTLLPGLLKAVAHNINRGSRDVRLFETGHVFRAGQDPPPSHEERKHPPHAPVDESVSLGIALSGNMHPRHWLEQPREATLWDLKGLVEGLMSEIGFSTSIGPLLASESLDPARSALVLVEGEPVGRLGALSSDWKEKSYLKQDVFVAELDLTRIYLMPAKEVRFTPMPRYPAVSRDLSLVVKKTQVYGEIEAAIREAEPGLIASIAVKDRYSGDTLPDGTVGLSINIVYQHPERTLTSEEVAALEKKILELLTSRFDVSLREQGESL